MKSDQLGVISKWSGSLSMTVRIEKKNYSVVCQVQCYKDKDTPRFSSYVIKNGMLELIGVSDSINTAKFACNVALKDQGYDVSLMDI